MLILSLSRLHASVHGLWVPWVTARNGRHLVSLILFPLGVRLLLLLMVVPGIVVLSVISVSLSVMPSPGR